MSELEALLRELEGCDAMRVMRACTFLADVVRAAIAARNANKAETVPTQDVGDCKCGSKNCPYCGAKSEPAAGHSGHTRDTGPCAVTAASGNGREEVGESQTGDADAAGEPCMPTGASVQNRSESQARGGQREPQ